MKCEVCGGTVGHKINCPKGICFTKDRKIGGTVIDRQVYQKCCKCGCKCNNAYTRTYPFINGCKTLCQFCYTSLQTKIERFFNV